MNRSNPQAEAAADPEDADSYQQAYATALRLLVRREHSALEIAHKLGSRQIPQDIAARVIEVLIGEGALSDRRFAEVYALGRFERGFGPLRIRAELRERGIDDALGDDALAALPGDFQDSASRERCKRFGRQRPAEFGERARQTRFLQQRGFTAGQIRAAFADAADNGDD